MKRELVEDREAANERLVKRIRLEKAPSFKKKGHEKQFRFNEEVREKIAAASDCLIATPPAVERAREALKEGEDLIVLQNLAALGLDPKRFGLHSLRSGGASAAANAGVPDRLFKRHGRWRSEMQRMVTLKILWEAGCLCHGILVCELNTNLDKLLFSLFHFLCSLTLHMGCVFCMVHAELK